MVWISEEEQWETKNNDRYRCQPHHGLQGKKGAQQLHLSCVNAVDSISLQKKLWTPFLECLYCGLHLY